MKFKTLLLASFFLCFFINAHSQNYLRVVDPDNWWGTNSSQPDWHFGLPHGIFTDLSLVVSPQGIYTEIEVYATITQLDNLWADELEIIWQFDLPAQTIVHDSWLWVEEDIIKADMVDYWTALTTYEGIVDRNEDPSFFYILPDNRYEIRIYPLFQDFNRRIKMSFLVPADWSSEKVSQELLLPMFQSTDYGVDNVSIAVPVNDTWGTPRLQIDDASITMNETVVGGSGQLLHYHTIEPTQFGAAQELSLEWEAPFNGPENTFVSTYENSGEKFYQLAYAPDWSTVHEDSDQEKMLFLVDYKASKTSISLEVITQLLLSQLNEHLSAQDALNIAVSTTTGTMFLQDEWWNSANGGLNAAVENLFSQQDTSDLATLLEDGLNWAQGQDDITQIYLLAANDDYFYPPVADEIFSNIENHIDENIELTILDYQNENVSVIYYSDDVYHGNSYLYQLLQGAFINSDLIIARDESQSLSSLIADLLPPFGLPEGVLDYNVNLQNGVCYERFTLSSNYLNSENNGVLLQTGKYLGNFPLQIEGYLITENEEFYTINAEVEEEQLITGDTLMREIWYGQLLPMLFGQVASNEDREDLINLSIAERILTPLTAFLALEPELGGEPCIGCLLNDGYHSDWYVGGI